MTYDQALEYIHSRARFGSKPGLDRVAHIMARFGDPHKKTRFVHVAGTNGKGSVTAMTASVLRRAGYRTGMFTSPYLEDFRERIQLDGELIPRDTLARYADAVREAAEGMEDLPCGSPTEYELVTAIAFLYYADAGAEVVALEVGMGGAHDMTNIIDTPLAAVITSISRDHTAWLGDTLSEIAAHKSGIIKDGGHAVCAPGQDPAVMKVIQARCESVGGTLTLPDMSKLGGVELALSGTRFTYRDREYALPLLGRHQLVNAVTVLETVEALRAAGLAIPYEAARDGMAETVWPARFEVFRGPGCDTVLDAGHNDAGVDTALDGLALYYKNMPVTAVMGMFSDKEYVKCIGKMAAASARFIAVSPHGSPRALPAAETAAIARVHCAEVYAVEDHAEALRLARAYAAADGGVAVICGSLALAGEMRPLVRNGC